MRTERHSTPIWFIKGAHIWPNGEGILGYFYMHTISPPTYLHNNEEDEVRVMVFLLTGLCIYAVCEQQHYCCSTYYHHHHPHHLSAAHSVPGRQVHSVHTLFCSERNKSICRVVWLSPISYLHLAEHNLRKFVLVKKVQFIYTGDRVKVTIKFNENFFHQANSYTSVVTRRQIDVQDTC